MVYPSRFHAKVMRVVAVLHGLQLALPVLAWAWFVSVIGAAATRRWPAPEHLVRIGALLVTPPVLVAMGAWLLRGYHRIAKGVGGVNPVRLWTLSLIFNLLPVVVEVALIILPEKGTVDLPMGPQVSFAVWQLMVVGLHAMALVRELRGQRDGGPTALSARSSSARVLRIA